MTSGPATPGARPTGPPPAFEAALGGASVWAERRFWPMLAAISLAAMLCRGVILADYLKTPLAAVPLNDAQTYWDWAKRIAGGQLVDTVPFFSAPLYPYLLGLLRGVGGTLPIVYALQILADLVTAGLLACVARARFGASTGLLAATLFLLLQEPASFDLRVLAPSLHMLLTAVTWALLIRAQTKSSTGRLLAAGVVLGLLCLANAPALLLVPLIAVWLFWQSRRRFADLGRALVPVAAAALVIAPATLHNWWVSRDLFLIQAVGGITLRLGNHPTANGTLTPLPGISSRREQMHADAARMYHAATGKEPTWGAVDRYFRDQALEYWRADPRRAIELAARKLYFFLSSQNYGDIYQPEAEIACGQNRWLRLAPLPTPWLLGVSLVGVLLLLRKAIRYAPEWMLFTVPSPIVITLFFYSPRYRAPLLPIAAVTAAWVLSQVPKWRAHTRVTIAACAALAASIALGRVNQTAGLDLVDRSMAYFDLAGALNAQGNVDAAVQNWREGLRLVPGNVIAHVTLGDALGHLGRPAEALVEYRYAVALTPDDTTLLAKFVRTLVQLQQFDEAHEVLTQVAADHPDDAVLVAMLGETTARRGDMDQARALFARALQLAPDDNQIRSAYGQLLMWSRRWAEARDVYAAVARSAPDSFEAYAQMGRADAQLGDYASAQSNLSRALQRRPGSIDILYDLGSLAAKDRRFADAADYFRRALAVDPNDAKCRAALQQVEELQASKPGE